MLQDQRCEIVLDGPIVSRDGALAPGKQQLSCKAPKTRGQFRTAAAVSKVFRIRVGAFDQANTRDTR